MLKLEHSMKILKLAVERIECNFQDGWRSLHIAHFQLKRLMWKGCNVEKKNEHIWPFGRFNSARASNWQMKWNGSERIWLRTERKCTIIRSPNLWLTFGLSAHTTENQTNWEIGNGRPWKQKKSPSETPYIHIPSADSNVIHTWRTDSFRVLNEIGKMV